MKKKMNKLPEASLLWELLEYDLLNGDFYWRIDRGGGTKAGMKAGSIRGKYIRISIMDKGYVAQRLVIKWITGHDPNGIVEHADDNGLNNAFWNLSDSTYRANAITFRKLSRGGLRGWTKTPYGFNAAISIGYKRYNLGFYETPEEAHQTYLHALALLESDPSWRPPERTWSSTFKYVSKMQKEPHHTVRWCAKFWYKGKSYYSGLFDTEIEAWRASVRTRIFDTSLIDDLIEYPGK